jgi:acyl-CoA dehydrogenase
METLERYGTEAQKREWLDPLLEGTVRSCFAMTEPQVASSDATNIESRIELRGDHYVINGRKWWSTGAPDRRCKLFIFMGKTDPNHPDRHKQQSMILVPRDAAASKSYAGCRCSVTTTRRTGMARFCSRTSRYRPRTFC